MRNLILIMSVSFLMSCMTTQTAVGTYNEKPGTVYSYSKVRQVYLFWGCLPVGHAQAKTPEDGICEVVTRHDGVDLLITIVTSGIVTTYTIEVNDKK